ncbi:SAM-dependent methyltransferase [Okibacterium sp. HSC-33S16]|uniref:class I SAM-dependent methyltransferase n=1 Tax=Okibacterium sp. HSC-33S16 TaxID=2910965 RepID=UPI00209FD661|nr:class I SAM-dependent methyltransferase [Okibacterium sp. HSC-33S16]MCP2030057.1 SAM-dependent methyltransferase [Okibacterium sp. HSC-33S16]
MDRAELVELLTPSGLTLLDSVGETDAVTDVVGAVSRLRAEGHSATLVAAVLTQVKLRRKAVGKFGDFASRMLFTEAGLEQATRLRVAALHAGRFSAAGLRRVADLGCGIGGDAMALAAMDLAVTAVDADEVTATVASYNLAPFPTADVRHARAEDVDASEFDALYFDPARRSAGHSNTTRLTRPEDYSPSLDLVFDRAASRPVGVKLGPGYDRSLIPDTAEAQWISVDGQVVELGLWFGALGRPGIHRSALVLNSEGTHELTAAADSDDVDVRPLGQYLYEPDGAVIRARLIGDVARTLDAGMLSPGIAYLTGDQEVRSPFVSTFRVLERFPLDERTLKRELANRKIGTLEVKKRGADIDPAAFRKKMALRGSESATLVLTRVDGKHAALLCERVR